MKRAVAWFEDKILFAEPREKRALSQLPRTNACINTDRAFIILPNHMKSLPPCSS